MWHSWKQVQPSPLRKMLKKLTILCFKLNMKQYLVEGKLNLDNALSSADIPTKNK